MKKLKAFTLIELVIVIGIIGVLASILVPNISSQMRLSRLTSVSTQAQEVYEAAQTYLRQLETQGRDASDYFGYDSTSGLGHIGVSFSRTDSNKSTTTAPVVAADIKSYGTGTTSATAARALDAANGIVNQLSASFEGAFIVFVYPKTYTVAYVLFTESTTGNSSVSYNYEGLVYLAKDVGALVKFSSDGPSDTEKSLEWVVRYATKQGATNASYYSGYYIGQYPIPVTSSDTTFKKIQTYTATYVKTSMSSASSSDEETE